MAWDQVVAWLIVPVVGCPLGVGGRLLLAKVFSNVGITLTVLAVVYLALGTDMAFRWLLAAELVLIGGLCLGVAHGLMLRSPTA